MTNKKENPPTTAADWLRKFNGSALYKHEPSRLFEDYLDLVLCCVANRQREEHYLKVAKRYTKDELVVISELFAMHVLIHEHQTAGGGWYDMLGDIYMDMAGRSRTSRMGQFFTPAEVCDLMARMTLDGDTTGKTMLDCCAGSGRMLLAGHALAPELGTLYAADLDGICVKMCALNFWLHGIRGEVAHMNSLTLEWYGAYHVHPRPSWPFVTYLDDARKEECHQWVNRAALLQKSVAVQAPSPDLFNQVSEPAEPYGADDDEPFKPCSLCGRDRSDTCVLVAGRIMEPWTMHGDDDAQPVCTGCGRGLLTPYRAPVEHREDLAAERKPLYGVRAKAQRYLDNDRRMTLERLEDLLVVLRRHHAAPEAAGMDRWQREREQERAHQALWNNREKVAMELRLRDAELVHDSIRCRIGRAECLFRADTLPELIKEYRRNTKQAA